MREDQFEEDFCFTCAYWCMVYEIHPTYRFKDKHGNERPAVQAAAPRCTKIAAGCDGQHWEKRREQIIYAEGASCTNQD